MSQTPQFTASSDDPEQQTPWLRRTTAVMGWLLGFALAIGLVIAAVLIPVGFTVATATEDQVSASDAASASEEASVAQSELQDVTLEAEVIGDDGEATVTWQTNRYDVQQETFTGSWSQEVQIPSGSWPSVTVQAPEGGGELEIRCAVKLDGDAVNERWGTRSTETATCGVFV